MKEENDIAKDLYKEPQVQIDYCCGSYSSEYCVYCNKEAKNENS